MAIIIVILIILALGYQIAQAEAFRNVQVTVQDVSIGNVGLTSADLNLDLGLYNPAPIPATVSSITYTIYTDNNYLGSGAIYGPISIAPHTTITEQTTFTLSHKHRFGI